MSQNFRIPISLHFNVGDLRYFKLWIILDKKNDSLKYQRLTPSGCKDIAIWKSEVVAKTQFFCTTSTDSKCCARP